MTLLVELVGTWCTHTTALVLLRLTPHVGIDLVWGWQFWIQVGPIICAGLAFAAIFVPFIIGAIYSALKKANPSQIAAQLPQPEHE